jgi:hypothetical protein
MLTQSLCHVADKHPSTTQHTPHCLYIHDPSILRLHYSFIHAEYSFYPLLHNLYTYVCMYRKTDGHNTLLKCFIMFWHGFVYCLCGTEVTQTVYCFLQSAQCCSESKVVVWCTELTLDVLCTRECNASYKWHTVQLTVTITVIVHSMPVTDFWFNVLLLWFQQTAPCHSLTT